MQINISGRYNDDDYTSDNIYDNDDFNQSYSLHTVGKRLSLLSSALYSYRFSESSELSISYENLISRNDNTYLQDHTKVSLTENNNYVYARYQQSIGKIWLTATTGMRFDNINYNGNRISFTNNNSSLMLQYNITDYLYLMCGIEYSPDVYSPRLLIDVPQQTNMYQVSTGNPNLKRNEDLIQYLSAGYSTRVGTMNLNLNYHFDHVTRYNPILTSVLYSPESNVYISRPENGHTWNKYSTYLQASLDNIFNMFSVNGMLNYLDYEIDNGKWKKKYHNLTGNFSVTWQYKKWAVQYSKSFPTWFLNGYKYSTLEHIDYLTLQFRPNKHWTFSAGWYYMFSKKGWEYEEKIFSPEYNAFREREIHNSCNWVRLTISYDLSFGELFRQKGSGRKLNNSDKDTMVTKFNL